MHFFLAGPLTLSVSTTTLLSSNTGPPSTAGPATTVPPFTVGPGVVTIEGGPNATAHIPGPQSDPADLYGIVLVVLAIAVALIATRWLFGRRSGPGSR